MTPPIPASALRKGQTILHKRERRQIEGLRPLTGYGAGEDGKRGETCYQVREGVCVNDRKMSFLRRGY